MLLRRIWRHLWEKKLINVFVEFHHWTEAVTGGALFTGKNLCWSPFAGPQVCSFIKKRHQHFHFSLFYFENFKNTCFEEHLRTAASFFMKKNRNSWRLNNSNKKTKINRNLWVFVFENWRPYKEKFKENTCKSKQIPGGELSCLAGTKFNFLM